MADDLMLLDDSNYEPIRVAIHAKTKHPDLWPLAESLGSVKKLSDMLGIRYGRVVEWVSLKSYPSYDVSRSASMRLHSELNSKLIEATGKDLCELWPDELRLAIDGGIAARKHTKVVELAMSSHVSLTRQRLELPSPADTLAEDEDRECKIAKLQDALRFLSYREREIIKLRHGLFGHEAHTLEEIGVFFKVTEERIRQIEAKAFRKIQRRMVSEAAP